MSTAVSGTTSAVHRQRLQALAAANHIRSTRAAIRHGLKRSQQPRKMAADLIANPPSEIGSWHVTEFLLTVPKIGPTKLKWAMCACQISESKTLEDLTSRQRNALVRWMLIIDRSLA